MNEPDTKDYREFKARRQLWIEWLAGDDVHAITRQISQMLWDAAAYRVINEARRYAEKLDNGGVALNGMVHVLIDKCFFESQVSAIRRLMDKRSDIVSLYRLLQDMHCNSRLMTREHMLAAEGLEYDYKKIEEAWGAKCAKQPRREGSLPRFVPPEFRWDIPMKRHLHIDALCGVGPGQRSPGDSVRQDLLRRLKDSLVSSGEDITKYVNKFIAHAATSQSRATADADHCEVTFGHLWNSQKTICKTANLASVCLLGGADYHFLPVPQYNQFEYIERPLVASTNIPRLRETWCAYIQETQDYCRLDCAVLETKPDSVPVTL